VHAGHYAATDGLRRYAACFVCLEMVSALLDLWMTRSACSIMYGKGPR